MRRHGFGKSIIGFILTSAASTVPASAAWNESVVYTPLNDPNGSLALDSAGNLYGTTLNDGGYGNVFMLSPPANGSTDWTEQVLYNFVGRLAAEPTSSVIIDPTGALYGTIPWVFPSETNGFAYKLTPPAKGQTNWTETTLASFKAAKGGVQPAGSLIADKSGNFYGATSWGGAFGGGTVFKLSPPSHGNTKWQKAIIYSFSSSDCRIPYGSLTVDKAGNLYGGNTEGGYTNNGCIFQLSPPAKGNSKWTENVIYQFQGGYGPMPSGLIGPLVFDSAGNFYGASAQGGINAQGTVFELIPPANGNGAWTENTLFEFSGPSTGFGTTSGVIFDPAGNLYGETGGQGGGFFGTV